MSKQYVSMPSFMECAGLVIKTPFQITAVGFLVTKELLMEVIQSMPAIKQAIRSTFKGLNVGIATYANMVDSWAESQGWNDDLSFEDNMKALRSKEEFKKTTIKINDKEIKVEHLDELILKAEEEFKSKKNK